MALDMKTLTPSESLLDQIGLRTQTDKASNGHGYLVYYQSVLQHLKDEPITLIELGAGGYEFPDRGGQSHRMWEQYFPKAHVITVDLYPKQMIPKSQFVQASQDDITLRDRLPMADIIIDDASHINSLTITTLENLWCKVKPGGYYIVEDVHTSYWDIEYNGNPDPKQGQTSMNYLKNLTDQLNHVTLLPEYRRDEWRLDLEWMLFLTEAVILKKKELL